MKVHLNEEIRTYMQEVAIHDVLTREQEIELFQRLEAGDAKARAEIVAANLRFVIKMAIPYAGRGMSVGDLIQEGNIGLLEVVDKFDWRRGFRFSTYAAFWIRQAIQLAVRKHANVIRIPIRKSRMLVMSTKPGAILSPSTGVRPPLRNWPGCWIWMKINCRIWSKLEMPFFRSIRQVWTKKQARANC